MPDNKVTVLELAVNKPELFEKLPVKLIPVVPESSSVPAVMVMLPVTLDPLPDKVNWDVALFCVTPVTFEPITPLMVVAPVVVPWLVIEPASFMEAFDSVTADEPVPFMTMFPVPEMAPLNVSVPAVGANVKLFARVTVPLKVALAEPVMLNVPLLPVATLIGLAKVNAPAAFNVADALPLLCPMVIILASAPNAFASVEP